jgi:hypothetical protein
MRKNEYIIKNMLKGAYQRPKAEVICFADGMVLLAGSVNAEDESNDVSGVVYDGENVVPGGTFTSGGDSGEEDEAE